MKHVQTKDGPGQILASTGLNNDQTLVSGPPSQQLGELVYLFLVPVAHKRLWERLQNCALCMLSPKIVIAPPTFSAVHTY